GWAAAVLLAVAAGFAGMNAFAPRDTTDEELSRDLRVIENRRYYEPIDNIDFLWQQEQSAPFAPAATRRDPHPPPTQAPRPRAAAAAPGRGPGRDGPQPRGG